MSKLKMTFMIGGDLEVNRLGFGAMRLTGEGIWGEPKDGNEVKRVLKNVPSILVSKKTRTSTGTMRFIGERMARAFPWSFGPILSFGKVKPSGP